MAIDLLLRAPFNGEIDLTLPEPSGNYLVMTSAPLKNNGSSGALDGENRSNRAGPLKLQQ